MRTVILYAIVITSLLYSCKEDDPAIVETSGSKILIANEGNFGWGEGTLSIYYEDSETIEDELYSKKNNESLGNVFQSIAFINEQYFFVVNNSSKVVVANKELDKIGEINGLTSPRNIYQVSDNKAYITDLYANAISVLDLKSLKVIGSIPCNGHSEEGIVKDGIFWFTTPETENIYAIDITKDLISDSINHIGWMPEGIIQTKDENIWVLGRGDASRGKSANLSVINSNLGYTVNQIEGTPTSLTYDSVSNCLYYLNNGIWKVDLNDPSDRGNLWIEDNNKVFYNLEVNPANGDLYVSDVKDFVSKSTIYRFSKNKALLNEFKAGIIAGDFFFNAK